MPCQTSEMFSFQGSFTSQDAHLKTPASPLLHTYKAHFPLTRTEWGSFNDRLYAFVKALKSKLLRFIFPCPRCFIKSLCMPTLWKTLSFSFDGFRMKEIRLLRNLLTWLLLLFFKSRCTVLIIFASVNT